MHNIKISTIKSMKASTEQLIEIDCTLDLEHLVSTLDEQSFNLLFALTQKRIADAAIEDARRANALANLATLRAALVKS
jgi:hypothetical protein